MTKTRRCNRASSELPPVVAAEMSQRNDCTSRRAAAPDAVVKVVVADGYWVMLLALSASERESLSQAARGMRAPYPVAHATLSVAFSITGWNLTDANGAVLPHGTIRDTLAS